MKKRFIYIFAAAVMAVTTAACSVTGQTQGTVTENRTVLEKAVETVGTVVDLSAESVSYEDGEQITLSDGEDVSITSGGTYVLSGEAKNVTVYVEADGEEVTIVLSDADITNKNTPCIYVKDAKKVTVATVKDTVNTLTVTGEFAKDGDEEPDAVIYSKDDLVFKGEGTLVIDSSNDAVRTNDDLKIKSGTIEVDCEGNAFKSHDGIEISGGTIVVNSCNDGIHAEDSDDDTKGSIVITGGSVTINADDDAIHATTTIRIDDGTLVLKAAEGIEGTQITVNGGDISITASDDGINAARKSSSLTPVFELNGGNVVISMGAGDTDGVDSNGNIYINGGTIDITGQSTFDYDGEAQYNGGTIIENGTETNTITNQFMGGGPGGQGFGGGQDFGGDRGFREAPDGQELPEDRGFQGGPGGQDGQGSQEAPDGQGFQGGRGSRGK